MKANTKNLSKLFKALSDENRLRILLAIRSSNYRCRGARQQCGAGETCVKELAKSLEITVPTVSHHVKELIGVGLVSTRKEGRWVYCRIGEDAFDEALKFLGFVGFLGDFQPNKRRKR